MTLPENWTPSDNMKAALAKATELEWNYGATDLCKAVGVSREAYYDWHRNPSFVKWWDTEWERWFALRLPEAWTKVRAAVGKPSSETNMAAAKLLVERFDKGYAPRSRQDVSADVEVRKTYICVDTAKVTGVEDKDEEDGE